MCDVCGHRTETKRRLEAHKAVHVAVQPVAASTRASGYGKPQYVYVNNNNLPAHSSPVKEEVMGSDEFDFIDHTLADVAINVETDEIDEKLVGRSEDLPVTMDVEEAGVRSQFPELVELLTAVPTTSEMEPPHT